MNAILLAMLVIFEDQLELIINQMRDEAQLQDVCMLQILCSNLEVAGTSDSSLYHWHLKKVALLGIINMEVDNIVG